MLILGFGLFLVTNLRIFYSKVCDDESEKDCHASHCAYLFISYIGFININMKIILVNKTQGYFSLMRIITKINNFVDLLLSDLNCSPRGPCVLLQLGLATLVPRHVISHVFRERKRKNIFELDFNTIRVFYV